MPKIESRFFTCPCHKIYRVEALGLSLRNQLLKITIFVSMWNLGNFQKNDILSINHLIWLMPESQNPFAHMWQI